MSAAAVRTFSSRRSLAPTLWALLCLGVMEVLAVHLLVAALWSGWAALALSIVALPALVWIVLLIRSLATAPVLLDPDRVLLRAGRLAGVSVARADVAVVRADFDGATVKARSTLRLSLASWPNLLVELTRPYRARGRSVDRVALRLDDPTGFAAALTQEPARGG